MWLDRLSGQSTPSAPPAPAQSRSYSPAPRRSSHLPPGPPTRPAYGPRTTSLGLSSKANFSTNSLNSPRLPNGSSLRQQLSPPADVIDPLGVLKDILGKQSDKVVNGSEDGDSSTIVQKPPHVAEDIDFEGLSLHAFVDRASQQETKKVHQFAAQTVEELQTSLMSFQQDLGAVSAEIETLQSRSTAMNNRLENRRVVEKLLGPAVEEISVSPAVVLTLTEGQIDTSWVKALDELDKRSKTIDARFKDSQKTSATSDVKPLLEDLRNKAIERIRDFFVSQIKALRSPNINAQIIQQQSFVRYKDLYSFLARHHSVLAEEIGQAYINTMRWYYLSSFTRYKQALEKIPIFVVDKNDAIGADPNIQRASANKASQPQHDPLTIGRRMDVLKRLSQSALASHLAEDNKQTHYLETPFLHFNLALIENATAEYSFLANFFSPAVSFRTISRHFSAIFSPIFALGHAYTKSLVEESDDCLGILLCVRLSQHFAFELQRRKVPVADGYINGTNMLLWPRFQLAMDVHTESIKRATSSVASARGTASALGLSTAGAFNQSTAPHMLTQRFGQFLQGVLALSREAGDNEPVGNSLNRVRAEVESFLMKIGKGFGSAGERKRDRFLANNYSLILTIVGDIEGKLAAEVRDHFEGLRDSVGGA
ncbi:MAG: hypothetical protein Q9184_002401 [Pyrenodesmia sp. 2 TL-2023]